MTHCIANAGIVYSDHVLDCPLRNGDATFAGELMEPVTLDNLLNATNGRAVGFDMRNVAFHSISLDSRAICPGDLFWAMPGTRFDGHDFTDDAMRHGASGCVVQLNHPLESVKPRILVNDTLAALSGFSAWYRKRQHAVMIAVTGSVGKTTTREMIYACLSAEFSGTRSPQNYNNEFGLPLSLLTVENRHVFAVVELGASHIGEIRNLCDLALPEVGVVTAVSPAHLEGFGDEATIRQAKGELLDCLPENGLAVLPGDEPHLRSLASRARCPVVFVGEQFDNHFVASHIHAAPRRLTFRVDGQKYVVPVSGRHYLTSALCAIAVGREMGMKCADIAEGLHSFVPARGRCEYLELGPWTVIDDSYNASPASMRAACRLLADWPATGKKLLVVGDMLELGSRSPDYHRDVGSLAVRSGADVVLAMGAMSRLVVEGARDAGMGSDSAVASCDFETLIQNLERFLDPGDLLLVKGSRAVQMERVVTWLKRQAAKALEEYKPGFPARVIV